MAFLPYLDFDIVDAQGHSLLFRCRILELSAAVKLAAATRKDLGLKVTPDTLSAYVEAAVHALPATAKE